MSANGATLKSPATGNAKDLVVEWLEHYLQQYAGTVIAITHDRYFLDNVSGWILELDRGEGIPWKGNYTSWLEQKTARMAGEEKQASKRRKTLERELEWVRMAPKARHAKGKARLEAYDRLINEDEREKEEKLELFIPNGPRLGIKLSKLLGFRKLSTKSCCSTTSTLCYRLTVLSEL